ncbi:MAG: hypothetical protein ACI9P5_004527 [Saprospiraceae bacterium]|jgi:hypothetical protein
MHCCIEIAHFNCRIPTVQITDQFFWKKRVKSPMINAGINTIGYVNICSIYFLVNAIVLCQNYLINYFFNPPPHCSESQHPH